MVLGERESPQREFDQGNPERPDVRLDGILSPLNPFGLRIGRQSSSRGGDLKGRSTHAHISRRTDESVGDRIDQLSRHSEITDFDLPFGVEEDVGGFDVYGITESPQKRKKKKQGTHVSKPPQQQTFALDRGAGK